MWYHTCDFEITRSFDFEITTYDFRPKLDSTQFN